MAFSILIAEAAENDISQAYIYYEKQSESLGDTFENHISKALDSIATPCSVKT
ncbi:MAG: hypothetical protein ACJAZ3_002031 [Sphingobacteriales bacterium]|jgi:hypothetical protein